MQNFHITMSGNGRILIPAAVRDALHLQEGEKLTLSFHPENLNQPIELKSRHQVIKEIQDFFSSQFPKDVSIVDELIKERRAEAEREAKKYE